MPITTEVRRGMISVEEALEKILSHAEALEREEKPILECLGQVLAEDIFSTINIPPYDNSAMDGYAVRAEDTHGASRSSPMTLTIIGEVAAGYVPQKEVKQGTAIRIMTGAPLPRGADAVVQFENTDEASHKTPPRAGSSIAILHPADKGLNVRRQGEDITRGALVLEEGRALRPSEIGVLASIGRPTAVVIRRPVVSILSTGDELTDIHQPLSPGKIYNSNTYTMAAQVIQYGGIPRILGIGTDSLEALNRKINEGLDSDMLITSGGVSMGDYDVVKDVLAKRGKIAFWTVRMKPGKPLAFGVIKREKKRDLLHLGLPGNPVSSMITFEQFARPAILMMMGKKELAKPSIQAVLQDSIKNRDGRRIFARVFVTRRGNRYHAHVTGPQGSGILTSMAKANGLAIVPEGKSAKPGDLVQVQMLHWEQELAQEE